MAVWPVGLETSVASVAYGYLFGGGLMLLGALAELLLGVKAEQRSLEDIATPLSARPGPQSGTRVA